MRRPGARAAGVVPGLRTRGPAVAVVVAFAPGRVNLLGEHTDYNDGCVLPIALAQRTTVSVGRAKGAEFTLLSEGFAKPLRFMPGQLPDEPFGRYVFGCIREIERRGHAVAPLDIHVSSDLPMGVGLTAPTWVGNRFRVSS